LFLNASCALGQAAFEDGLLALALCGFDSLFRAAAGRPNHFEVAQRTT
jgi:hypothetical protein